MMISKEELNASVQGDLALARTSIQSNELEQSEFRSKDYADIRFTELVGEAPATLNTIHELAAMIQTLKAEDVDGLVELLSRKVDVGEVGSLTSLQTTAKASLVDAVNELFTEVDSGKTLVGNAIEAKGAIVPTNPTFNDLVQAVSSVPTGGRMAHGTINAANDFIRFYSNQGASANYFPITVSGLGFAPTTVIIARITTAFDGEARVVASNLIAKNTSSDKQMLTMGGTPVRLDGVSAYLGPDGFRLPYSVKSELVQWIAYE